MAFSTASMRVQRLAARPLRGFKAPRSRGAVRTYAATAADLDKQFGIAGFVSVEEGLKGSTKVVLKHASGCKAEIYLFGACITSWTQPSGDEVLYVRPDAVFDKSKPISGGIPHCFPQFGPPGKMQQHGFARNLEWAVSATSADPNPDERDPTVELVLTPNEYTLKMWPFQFKAVYTISLHGEQLCTDFRVVNTDSKPFDFTAALHSYIEVLSVDKAKVSGLKGLTYLNKVPDPVNPSKTVESRDKITFDGKLLDSVYLNAPSHVELEVGTGAAVAIDSSGWSDIVVWNPGETMPSCFDKFVCVENAQTSSPVVVKPGDSWRGQMTMQVVDL